MNAKKQTVIVTGANRGIGLEICRQLARLGHRVLLTSRDETKGRAAADSLKAEGEIIYHPLDVTSSESIQRLREFVVQEFGAADALVNNAAININSTIPVLEVDMKTLQQTFDSNVRGPLLLCQAFIPLMVAQNYGRVVNVSSGASQIESMRKDMPAYRLSKIALNSLTKMLADNLRGTNVLVNSACPGWVKTDMGGPGADREVEQGADGIVWLATLPDGGPSGGFFRDRKPIPW